MPFKYPPIEERFWPQVDKSGECWIWTGYKAMGYGKIIYKGKSTGVHRVSYELEYGEIPEGMDVCHNCPNNQDNPLCVRPTHLWVGTHYENMVDRDKKGRHNPARGERAGAAKLTTEKVVEIRNLHSQGVTQTELAARYGVTYNCIFLIVNRVNWKHVA